MQKIPVYVISLKRCKKRRESIKSHLEQLNISFEMIDAVDGGGLGSDYIRTLTCGNKLSAAEVGCYLSHMKVYELMVSRQNPLALILEDDVVLDPQVKDLLDHGCGRVDFDYCFLSSSHKNSQGRVFYDKCSGVQLCDGIKAYLLSAGPHSTYAYLMTLPAARNRLQYAFPIKKPIDRYELLPYKPLFRRTIPDLAWLNKHSLTPTIIRPDLKNNPKFPLLSRLWWYQPLREKILLRGLKRYLNKRRLIKDGVLKMGVRWKDLPGYRKIIRDR